MGRRKVKLKRIEDEKTRRAVFSKLLGELFQEACELSSIYGAEVGIMGMTPDGKPFSFGFPSAEAVMSRYLVGNNLFGESMENGEDEEAEMPNPTNDASGIAEPVVTEEETIKVPPPDSGNGGGLI